MTLVPIEPQLPDIYAQIVADCRRQGFTIGTNDAWVAATAVSLDIPLATNNRRHFDRVAGLTLVG